MRVEQEQDKDCSWTYSSFGKVVQGVVDVALEKMDGHKLVLVVQFLHLTSKLAQEIEGFMHLKGQ